MLLTPQRLLCGIAAVYAVVFVLPIGGCVNARVCKAGLPACFEPLDQKANPPLYRAARPLEKNDLVLESDLVAPSDLPAGAAIWLPDKSDFAGRYIVLGIAAGAVIATGNLAEQPEIDPPASECLVSASPGAFSKVPATFNVGRLITLGCDEQLGWHCSEKSGWKVAALVEDTSNEGDWAVLVTHNPKTCDRPSFPVVIAVGK